VASCSGPAGVIILAADGVHEVGLTLFPDRIESHRLEARAEVNLADGVLPASLRGAIISWNCG
jgi:hypothetical protein